jgi:peptidoglycan hydrolase-like protein with peptidoglycan-binding domain
MAPAAMAQSASSGADQTTGTTGEHDRHNQSMGDRGAKQGDTSRIRRAQEALKSEGHDPGPIDGVMGPKTQEALRQYQKQENLRQTGRLDQETMSKLGV